ncbi:MAG TPA: transcriptional regulator [Acidimicrobiia bacterium]|nr:transcriptional regulator [Acidimicrobiia bacterium]
MSQVTWRADDELVLRLKERARERGVSLNEYITLLARAATDPDLAATETDRLRERLALAGLLATGGQPRRRPSSDEVADARRKAGRGTPLSSLITKGR